MLNKTLAFCAYRALLCQAFSASYPKTMANISVVAVKKKYSRLMVLGLRLESSIVSAATANVK